MKNSGSFELLTRSKLNLFTMGDKYIITSEHQQGVMGVSVPLTAEELESLRLALEGFNASEIRGQEIVTSVFRDRLGLRIETSPGLWRGYVSILFGREECAEIAIKIREVQK